MKHEFEAHRFHEGGRSWEWIQQADAILAEFEARGYRLTVRQLYYQFVARLGGQQFPNDGRTWRRFKEVMKLARLSGDLDWDQIEDRLRPLHHNAHWDSPREILEAVAKQYRRDTWAGQRFRVEVWVEKDALVQVVGRVCRELDIAYVTTRGFPSISTFWAAHQRWWSDGEMNYVPVVLHLADHDPAGMAMTDNLRERMEQFGPGVVQRIGLTMEQVKHYNPPPQTIKDSTPVQKRLVEAYRKKFGRRSWELDALQPDVIADLIREHATDPQWLNPRKRAKEVRRQDRERRALKALARQRPR